MSRVLYVLAVTTGSSGVAVLILSLLLDRATLLHAGLFALLVCALLLIAVVLTGHRGLRGHSL